MYTFKDLAKEILSKSDEPLTIREIWELATTQNISSKISSIGKTPINTLSAILGNDVIKYDSIFIKNNERPAKFSLKNKNYIKNEEINTIQQETESTFKERDLHRLLSTFAKVSPYFKCLTKTIYHEKSNKTKKGKNEWLHPDIVGVYYPFNDYSEETLKLYSVTDANPYKIFSFELKIKIDYTNLREYYFQSVSNSSWANEGYLVALEIDDDVELYEELKRLNNSFGIGIIKLNPNNISQSEILFSAKLNNSLDFNTIDRLAIENPDFKSFISDISTDTKDNDPRLRGEYDKFFDDDETTREYCLNKKIINHQF